LMSCSKDVTCTPWDLRSAASWVSIAMNAGYG
jgi:hypothetical protein